ncbi:hypothetical protein LDENG_00069270 [Scomber scombrus]|uniref:Uncharacterized protein n=1 Tax=Scomber scombrus TaxID=13677 RepID=A0AAV1NAQ8_SCOSC
MHVHSVRKKRESKEGEDESSASIGRSQEETIELKKRNRAEDISVFFVVLVISVTGAAILQQLKQQSPLDKDTVVFQEWKRCSAQLPVTSSCLVQVSWTETRLTPTAVPVLAASPSVLSLPPWEHKSHPTGYELRSANNVECPVITMLPSYEYSVSVIMDVKMQGSVLSAVLASNVFIQLHYQGSRGEENSLDSLKSTNGVCFLKHYISDTAPIIKIAYHALAPKRQNQALPRSVMEVFKLQNERSCLKKAFQKKGFDFQEKRVHPDHNYAPVLLRMEYAKAKAVLS